MLGHLLYYTIAWCAVNYASEIEIQMRKVYPSIYSPISRHLFMKNRDLLLPNKLMENSGNSKK